MRVVEFVRLAISVLSVEEVGAWQTVEQKTVRRCTFKTVNASRLVTEKLS